MLLQTGHWGLWQATLGSKVVTSELAACDHRRPQRGCGKAHLAIGCHSLPQAGEKLSLLQVITGCHVKVL